jgi:hypothetical protein
MMVEERQAMLTNNAAFIMRNATWPQKEIQVAL